MAPTTTIMGPFLRDVNASDNGGGADDAGTDTSTDTNTGTNTEGTEGGQDAGTESTATSGTQPQTFQESVVAAFQALTDGDPAQNVIEASAKTITEVLGIQAPAGASDLTVNLVEKIKADAKKDIEEATRTVLDSLG